MSKRNKVEEIFGSVQSELGRLQETPSALDDDRRLRKLNEYRPLLLRDADVASKSRNWQRSRDKARLLLQDAYLRYTACGKNVVCLCVLASNVTQLGQLNENEIKIFIEELKQIARTLSSLPRLSSLAEELFDQELEDSFKTTLRLPAGEHTRWEALDNLVLTCCRQQEDKLAQYRRALWSARSNLSWKNCGNSNTAAQLLSRLHHG